MTVAQATVVAMRAGRSAKNLYMYIYGLMIEVIGAADKWGEGCRRRRGLKDGSGAFGPSHGKN